MFQYVLKNKHFTDINPIQFGCEKCIPSHSFGPATREYTLIHFVESGRGYFICNGKTYQVESGQAFIILPGKITTYYADQNDPWTYSWVGFDGKLSASFENLPPIVSFTTNWPREILSVDREHPLVECHVASKLFLMYAEWFAEKKEKTDYVKAVSDYINAKYIEPVSVEDIAARMNLDRRYLSRIFKQKTGKSIQEYLIFVRIEKAKSFLSLGHSVADASHLCGYDDVCNFSKMFKKQTGISPGKWGDGKKRIRTARISSKK